MSFSSPAASAAAAVAAAPPQPLPPPSPASLVRPCLEAIADGASNRKDLAELAERARTLLGDLDKVLRRCEPGQEVIVAVSAPAPAADAAAVPAPAAEGAGGDDEAAERQDATGADAAASGSDVGFFSSVPERGAARLMSLLSSAVETGDARL